MTQQPRDSGTDLVGEFQRWLVRSGTRGVSRELGGHFRTVFGRGQAAGDVWGSATAPPPTGEAAECAWCPVCRAARMLRESGPGLTAHVSTASGLLASVAQEAVSVVESVLASQGRPAGTGAGEPARPSPARDDGRRDGSGVWERAQSPEAGGDTQRGGAVESSPHGPDDRG